MPQLIQTKPKIGVSSCLLGEKVRFDGGHKRDSFLTDLFGKFVEWVAVCPEAEVGMGIPRDSVRLVGSSSHPKIIAEKSGRDWTVEMEKFSAERISRLAGQQLSGYVFKRSSPSCGMERVKIYDKNKQPSRSGRGLFAAAVMERLPLLPVEEEGRLNDLGLRENFIERVFAYRRWQDALSGANSTGALVRFHTRHKFLLLAHSERHYRQLGRIAATAKQTSLAQAYEDYGRGFMAALAIHATAKTHTNVLDHMMGYFSPQLTTSEREELRGLIHDYRRQLIPLIVPITLIRHYSNKYRVAYLEGQVYLEPSPKELMLRNHV
ncbi:MAG TPA: DUF523 and DUF1722 domain-containing protein [Candidatus Limnocylindrales bacterium]|nr:DUF523 and DUF1722 domain-containing protein [Candidatus Limnocylindrales bacterium]